MKYLVDTNILIYLLNSKSPRLQQRFTVRSADSFCVSAITAAELVYGAKKSRYVERNLQAAVKILSAFDILEFSGQDAFVYGDIRAELEARGKPIGGNDLLIAAQAMRLNLTMITANTREFSRVPGLRVENWADDLHD